MLGVSESVRWVSKLNRGYELETVPNMEASGGVDDFFK